MTLHALMVNAAFEGKFRTHIYKDEAWKFPKVRTVTFPALIGLEYPSSMHPGSICLAQSLRQNVGRRDAMNLQLEKQEKVSGET